MYMYMYTNANSVDGNLVMMIIILMDSIPTITIY